MHLVGPTFKDPNYTSFGPTLFAPHTLSYYYAEEAISIIGLEKNVIKILIGSLTYTATPRFQGSKLGGPSHLIPMSLADEFGKEHGLLVWLVCWG